MKKVIVFFIFLLAMAGLSCPSVWSVPVSGIYNGTTTGLGSDFDGFVFVTDAENDGASIGDELLSRDRSPDSIPGLPFFWGLKYLIRDTLDLGSFVNNGDGTGTRSFSTTRIGGTFYIWGDHLWGQDPGTIYTVSIEGEGEGMVHLNWDAVNEYWAFSKYEGIVHYWGQFNNDPFLFEFTSDVLLDNHSYNGYLDMIIYSGKLNNVQFEIDPVPEPTTMLLLGTGLIGLAGFRRKFKKG